MVKRAVIAPHSLRRDCPACGTEGRPRLYADANVAASQLDEYAFASRKFPEYMHWRLWECARCDLLYANPAPSSEQLANLYRDASFSSGSEARYAAGTYGRLLDRLLPELSDRDGALDIGTGDGAFLHELLDRNFTGIEGIEPSSAPIRDAAERVRPFIRQALFEPGMYAPHRFGLVSCFQTIEHVPDPYGLVKEAYRILKPGGGIFLIGHNRRALSTRLLGRRSPIFDVEHLQLFSPDSLGDMLENAGFRCVTITPFFNRYPLTYWVQLMPIPPKAKESTLKRLRASGLGRIPLALPAGNIAATAYK